MNTLAIGRFLAELIQLPYDCTLADIARALRAADEIVIRSVAGAFDIPCPGRDAKSLRGEFMDKIASAVHDVYAVCVEYADRPAPLREAYGTSLSLRDVTFNDNLRRETTMMLSQVQADMRLVTKQLRLAKVFPLEFATVDTLPIPVVRLLHGHLVAQKHVKEMVISSIRGGLGSKAVGALQVDMLARLSKPEVFLAGKILKGELCEFSPLERLFGIYSVGHLAVFAATVDYVPGESPIVTALLDASERLSFGPRGGELTFTSYAALVAALAEADSQELFFDVKHMFSTVVGAMEAYGKNKDQAWDGLLITEMRRGASFKARAAIAREPLDELMAALTALHEEHNDFARHSSRFDSLTLGAMGTVNTVLSATEPASWGGSGGCGGYFDDFQRDFDNVYRLGVSRPPRMCPKGLHTVPSSFDYCGECAVFFPDTYFCRTCNTPTQKELAVRGLCRGALRFRAMRRGRRGLQRATGQEELDVAGLLAPRAE